MARILLLPGIGDVYWFAVGAEAFQQRHGLDRLEVSIWNFDGRKRTQEYVQRIPFLVDGGYFTRHGWPGKLPEFREAYFTGERSVFPGFLGFDYFVAPNGALVTGRTINWALGLEPGELRWTFPLRSLGREVTFEHNYQRKYGRYILAHFSDFGMFPKWTKAWDARRCAEYCRLIHQATGWPVLLSGLAFDRPFSQKVAQFAGRGIECIAAQTPPDAFFALLNQASGCVGWCGGNTILAASRGLPSHLGWSETHFPDPAFYRNAINPSTWRDPATATYEPFIVERDAPAAAAERYVALVNRALALEGAA